MIESILNFFDKHPGLFLASLISIVGVIGINEVGNYNAMKNGYNRDIHFGGLDFEIDKSNLLLPSLLDD